MALVPRSDGVPSGATRRSLAVMSFIARLLFQARQRPAEGTFGIRIRARSFVKAVELLFGTEAIAGKRPTIRKYEFGQPTRGLAHHT